MAVIKKKNFKGLYIFVIFFENVESSKSFFLCPLLLAVLCLNYEGSLLCLMHTVAALTSDNALYET
jgi:hypothetical protein